ncbi:MAG: hypothetical protein WCK43_09140 [bacterium]
MRKVHFLIIFLLGLSAAQATDLPSARDCRATLINLKSSQKKYQEDPMKVWEASKNNPVSFIGSIDYRIKHIGNSEPVYQSLIEKLKNKITLTRKDAELITSIESDPILELISEEWRAMRDFEKFILLEYPQETRNLYIETSTDFKKFAESLIKRRREFRYMLSPGRISLAEAKMILESWWNFNHFGTKKTDKILDALTGTQAEEYNSQAPVPFQYSIPKAEKESPLSIINKTIESLGLKTGDTILDLQAGWGRTVLGAAILHPELNFIGIEKYPQKTNFTTHTIHTYKLTNIKALLSDYISSPEQKSTEKAKVIYTFEKLGPLKIKSLLEEIKEAAQKTNEKKYLILAGQEEVDAQGNLIDYSIQEVEP